MHRSEHTGHRPSWHRAHILHKFPTEELGAYPPEQTVVLALVPPLPNPRHRYSEGMKPLDNRNEIWRNYEAFKWAVDIV